MSAPTGQQITEALDYLRMPEVTKGKYAVVPVKGDRAAVAVIEAAIAEMQGENDKLRAMLANGSGPCAYCDLPHEDWPKCRSGFPGCGRADDAMLCPNVGASLEADERVRQLEAELAILRADKDRLDFLDRCNSSLNATYGTTYRWQLVMSHNVNRLLLGAGAVDLHDSAAGNTALPSCREAIDRKRAELARDRGVAS